MEVTLTEHVPATAIDSDPDEYVLMDKNEVRETTRLSFSTIDRKVRQGTFPPPLKVSSNRRFWRRSCVLAWMRDL